MSIRFTPNVLLSIAMALSLILAFLMLAVAMDQRWLGAKLTDNPRLATPQAFEGLWLNSIDRNSPLSRHSDIPEGLASITAISGADGRIIQLMPNDLIEEPDALASYAAMRDFFARQSKLNAVLRQPEVMLHVQSQEGDTSIHQIKPQQERPVSSLPLAFWLQIGVGLAGFWMGTWIWVLRRAEWATRMFALAGAGLLISAFPAAIYSTRELALPGDLFQWLSIFNHAGAIIFGMGMIGLFLQYPRKLVKSRWLLVPVTLLAASQVVDIWQLVEGPAFGFHLAVVLAMLSIITLVLVQLKVAKGNPRDRAILSWFGLSAVIGAGAFVATVITPNLLGIGSFVSQGEAFLFFLLVYIGAAFGVARFRLFQLGEWAFRILFYVIGVLLLLGLDAILIATIVDNRAPAFALSLLIVSLVWLPLRDRLERLLLSRGETLDYENLFRQVMDVALTPPGRDQHARWRSLLEHAFRPLSMEITQNTHTKAKLMEDGLALSIPAIGDLTSCRLEYADSGRKLFSLRDVALANELLAMLTNAQESRVAYEKGVAEERQRIARDIHDNIGVQLLGALHSQNANRKNTFIRETLTDLRDIINNAGMQGAPLDEVLADLRAQIAEFLCAANIALDWQVKRDEPVVLPMIAVHTLRSVIREAVQNTLKYAGAEQVSIHVDFTRPMLTIRVADDGCGFSAENVTVGHGLDHMRTRMIGLGGTFTLGEQANNQGSVITVQFPVT
ncbi:histidine kinase [Aliidiomarina taiwanensis]|uniref:Histidine kinase n=1 Tax=Aliidiomarina taiwanensis TaxID=946228 RepID=A0A432X8T5_9GAMM|nr:ATP-binding protein [Aliidiomarina taiwanensis]RUO43736.1 histidine kinase [Aliidiomarina taiwanensis]